MQKILAFLRALHAHNDREWFDDHRAEWKCVQTRFHEFTEGLIDAIASFNPSVHGLQVRDCTYRIHRDTRFSRDKSPFKTHMGAFIAPQGKKSGHAGYYFHIEPAGDGLLQGSGLSAGLYAPHPVVLRSVREEILDNGAEVAAAIAEATGFAINESNKLRRTPVGFPRGTMYDELLKLKDVFIERRITDEFLLSDRLIERTAEEFRRTKHFIDLLNRAVDYAREEMM